MRNPKTGRVNTLAEHAVNQMASSKNQRQYIAARGAALANGWRAERADGVYGQGWKSAPQQNTRMFTDASAPVGAMSADEAATQQSQTMARALELDADYPKEVAAKQAQQAQEAAKQEAARQKNQITQSSSQFDTWPRVAPSAGSTIISTNMMADNAFQKGLPHLAFGLGLDGRALAQKMDDYEAQKHQQAREKMRQDIETANQRFREEDAARRSQSNTQASLVTPASPAAGSRPDYNLGRKRKRGLSSLRAM
jgi:hypothetical protein